MDNADVLIYEEDPSQTRWDIEKLPPLGVCLIVEGDVILPDDPITPIDGDFEFHGIGLVLISSMDSEGYAHPSESPFGSSIDVRGQFNNALQGKYYQVLYAQWADDATPPNPGDFAPILDEVWPVAQKIEDKWVTIYKTPVELPGGSGAVKGCYKIPDYADLFLTSKDILIRWMTHRKDLGAPRYPNGKYTLKVRAFNEDGTEIHLSEGANKGFNVRVDNTWPVAKIREEIGIIGGTGKPDDPRVCGIIYIESGKHVQITFDAYDEQNHFQSYTLVYRSGHGVEKVISSKTFLSPSRNDFGYANEEVNWDIGTGEIKQCGYEIRLKVWDRTTNGYYNIHRSDDFIHLILLSDTVVEPIEWDRSR